MRKITKKQEAFIHNLVNDPDTIGNQLESYLKAYGCDRNTAKAQASKLLKRPEIKALKAQREREREAIMISFLSDPEVYADILANPGGFEAQRLTAHMMADLFNQAMGWEKVTRTELRGTGKGKQVRETYEDDMTPSERAQARKDWMKLAGVGQTKNINLNQPGPLMIGNPTPKPLEENENNEPREEETP